MEPDMNARREWMDAVDTLEKHPGFIAETELRHLDMSWRLFERNYHELKKYLSIYYDPVQSVKFWDVDKRDLLEKFTEEITRMLFNMTSSAMMLVDHTRVKMQELHEGTPLHEEYIKRVTQTFRGNDLHRFVQGLRNYFTHRALPYLSPQLNLDVRQGLSSAMNLQTADLLQWSGWDKHARNFIEQAQDGKIDVLATANDYYNLILSFQNWRRSAQVEFFRTELEELSERRKELRQQRDRLELK